MAGNVSERHPDYLDRESEWKLVRDCARGETKIKAEAEEYLPKPSAFNAENAPKGLYQAYQQRAQFPDIFDPTVNGLAGTIHRTEAQINLPAKLEPLWEKATPDGLTLEAFHARITRELLETGRYSILVGASSEGSDMVWLAGYSTEALINWSESRDFFVLDESGKVRNGFTWEDSKKFRVVELIDGVYSVRIFQGDNLNEVHRVTPQAKGGKPLEEIPFVVIGARAEIGARVRIGNLGVARDVAAGDTAAPAGAAPATGAQVSLSFSKFAPADGQMAATAATESRTH